MVNPEAFVDEGLGNSSYLVDLGDGSGLVVDPSRDPRQYLSAADRRALRIRVVAETHLHADFVSGARELLAAAPDAMLLAAGGARLAYPHQPVDDGTEIGVGGLTLRVLATPGHSPEHVSFLLCEGAEPQALFSGGALIVGGIARPDLVSADQTEPLARAAWRSLHDRVLPLPDELTVYPTHGGGSFCSAGSGDRRTTTIGQERRANPLLQAPDEDAFVERLFGGLGSFPPYFLRLREVNQRGPRLFGSRTPRLAPLGVQTVQGLLAEGGELIDVRPVDQFAAGHVPGALAIELRPQFGTWLGWLVEDPETPLVFVLDGGQDRDDLVRQCLNVGYEQLRGELAGGAPAWGELSRIELTDRPQPDRVVVDVRQRSEWDSGRIPGAVHIELGELPSTTGEIADGPIAVHCMHGQRSMTAASVLERAGHTDVAVYTAGPEEWVTASGQRLIDGR